MLCERYHKLPNEVRELTAYQAVFLLRDPSENTKEEIDAKKAERDRILAEVAART